MAQAARTERIAGAVGTALLQALLVYALLYGLGVPQAMRREERLTTIDLAPAPPPTKHAPERTRSRRREGATSPPNLRARPTEIVAPAAVVPLPVPSPLVAAPVGRDDTDPAAGAAEVVGPGYGSGGNGSGWGGGGRGEGDGAGDTPPRRLRGSLRNSDMPRSMTVGTASVTVAFRVATDGRVVSCWIERSSGNPDIDETTCRLIRRRFRYAPGRDAAGRPFEAVIVEDHSWQVDEVPPEERAHSR